jgi:hypothetical protein
MRFFIPFIPYIIVVLIAQATIWMDDMSKIRWQRATQDYKSSPSEYHKRQLAKAAATYIKQRNLSYFWWFWPITVPIWILIAIVKAPRAIYNHFKSSKGVYAQARKHMDGEVK